ncbi:MAG: biopolymer transporter ExbD [Planctomycetales bacterium]|nr:biopolymer transporter ExbD [Planctomycetales bacterium]
MDSSIEDLRRMRRNRGNEEPKMDITPMIDVTFLLLIFFIVASRPDPNRIINAPQAKFGESIVESNACIILLVDTGNPDLPDIHLGPSKAANKLTGAEEEMEQAIIDYVSQTLDGKRIKHVLIKAEKDVRYKHVHFVYAAAGDGLRAWLGDNESTGIMLHTAVEEKKN